MPSSWNGVIRQHILLIAIIEWGDPSAYGTRARCRVCGQRGLLLARKTMYLDQERMTRTFAGVTPASGADRVATDAFERLVTEEHCRGTGFRGAPEPICTSCG